MTLATIRSSEIFKLYKPAGKDGKNGLAEIRLKENKSKQVQCKFYFLFWQILKYTFFLLIYLSLLSSLFLFPSSQNSFLCENLSFFPSFFYKMRNFFFSFTKNLSLSLFAELFLFPSLTIQSSFLFLLFSSQNTTNLSPFLSLQYYNIK